MQCTSKSYTILDVLKKKSVFVSNDCLFLRLRQLLQCGKLTPGPRSGNYIRHHCASNWPYGHMPLPNSPCPCISISLSHNMKNNICITSKHFKNSKVPSTTLYMAFTCCVYFLNISSLISFTVLTHNSPDRRLFLSS